MTRIVVTADDFGLCPEINEAICLLHDRGIVHRTSFMVNTDWFESSVEALRSRPALEVGVHLNLTDGRPVLPAEDVPTLVNGSGRFHGGRHYGVIARTLSGRMSQRDIHREWRAQIAKARSAGIPLQQLNAHGHLHLLPQLHGIVLELLREFDIPQVRLTRSLESPRSVLLHLCSLGLMHRLGRNGLPVVCPDRTLGLTSPGSVHQRPLLRQLAIGGNATAELIVHPSKGANEYHGRWGYAGDDVLNSLLSDAAWLRRQTGVADTATADHKSAQGKSRGHSPTSAAPVSLIVPTYREAANVATLVRRVKAVAELEQLDLEMWIVDDRSDDGTIEAVQALGEGPWLALVVRDDARSLSRAVLEGLRRARYERCVVMDGDLSHPPEAIPRLLAALDEAGVDFVIGSRYIAGGTTDAAWPLARRLNSLVARLMARPLGIEVRDPTSGFFAVRRSRFLAATDLDPIGYKVGLELLIKCRCRNIREVPIHFQQRLHGKTKLGLRQRLEYVEHLRRLWWYRLRGASPKGQR
jgi:hypothetical protein